MKEYRKRNKEKIAKYQKEYDSKNADKRKIQKSNADKNYRTRNQELVKYRKTIPAKRFKTSITDAKRRNIVFDLTYDYWFAEVSKPCVYCQDKLGKRSQTTSGLDRVLNNLGYIEGNVVSCCNICNKIKNNFLTFEETLAAVQAILIVRNKSQK